MLAFCKFFFKGENAAFLNAKFFYIVLLNGLSIAFLKFSGYFYDFAIDAAKGFAWNFFLFFVLFFALSFLGRKILQIALNCAFWLSFAFSLINAFLIINFSYMLNAEAVQIFFATNLREAREFLEMFLNSKTIFALLILIIFTLFCLFIKPSLKLPKLLCAALSLVFIVILTDKIIQQERSLWLESVARKTQIIEIARVINLAFSEQNKAILAFKNMDEKMNAALKQKLERAREIRAA